jgi:hypothetical protein
MTQQDPRDALALFLRFSSLTLITGNGSTLRTSGDADAVVQVNQNDITLDSGATPGTAGTGSKYHLRLQLIDPSRVRLRFGDKERTLVLDLPQDSAGADDIVGIEFADPNDAALTMLIFHAAVKAAHDRGR